MKRNAGVLCLCVLLAGAAHAARGQSIGPHRPGLLREIRRRLIPPDAAEAWSEARRTPSALEALPLMENLARRDAAESSIASLWLGHFYYGAGDAGEASSWFARAATTAREDAVRKEARYWEEHCRNLKVSEGNAGPEPDRGASAASAGLAKADAQLRSGNSAAAWEEYLELESTSRPTGSFAPIFFRLARVALSGDGAHADFFKGHLPAWSAEAGPSPERALVRALAATLRRPAASPVPSEGSAPFAEPVDSSSVPPETTLARPDSAPPAAAPPATESYELQLGSFLDPDRARHELDRLQGLGLPVRLETEKSERGTMYKIRWGGFHSRDEAEEIARTRCNGLEWTIVPSMTSAP